MWAVFLLVHISVANVGENKRPFPVLDTGPYTNESKIRALYNGERLAGEYFGPPDGELHFNGSKHLAFNWAVSNAGGISGAYPGTNAEGWAPFVIAANGEPREVTIEIDWSGQTSRWSLGE